MILSLLELAGVYKLNLRGLSRMLNLDKDTVWNYISGVNAVPVELSSKVEQLLVYTVSNDWGLKLTPIMHEPLSTGLTPFESIQSLFALPCSKMYEGLTDLSATVDSLHVLTKILTTASTPEAI